MMDRFSVCNVKLSSTWAKENFCNSISGWYLQQPQLPTRQQMLHVDRYLPELMVPESVYNVLNNYVIFLDFATMY